MKVATGGLDHNIYIWDENGSIIQTLVNHTKLIQTLYAMPNGNLISGAWDSSIKIWNPFDGSLIMTLLGHTSYVYGLEMIDSNTLASASYDSTVHLWDINSGENLRNYTFQGQLTCLKLLPNGYLATGNTRSFQTLYIWDLTNGTQVYKLMGHSGSVTSLEVIGTDILASGSLDNSTILWNLTNGTLIKRLELHTGGIQCLKLIDNETLASGSMDTTIILWNITSGLAIKTLIGHSQVVSGLDLTTEGYLLSGSQDYTIRIWNISSGALLKIINNVTKVYTIKQIFDS